MSRISFFPFVCFLALAVWTSSAAANESDLDALRREMADVRAEYESRIQALEAQVAAMGARANPSEAGQPMSSWAPRLTIGGFSDFEYGVGRAESRTDGTSDAGSGFANGALDLFLTADVSDKASFLNETLFEAGEGGATVVDVERLLLQYELPANLALRLGRGHTTFGYWNTHFHHGKWLQTTVDRPLIYRFEDDGGILPMHFVGAELEGKIYLGEGVVTYSGAVANGRGSIEDQVQIVGDANDSKMVGGRVAYQTPFGLEFGANGFTDQIPGNSDLSPLRTGHINELIYGGYALYRFAGLELLGELQVIAHDDSTLDQRFHHNGGYAQASYAFGDLKPYYRYDFLHVAGGDPFFMDFSSGTGKATVEDVLQHTFGLRWDLAARLALKLEYRYGRSTSTRSSAGALQASYAF